MSSYIIQDRIEVSIFLNGVSYPVQAINNINFIKMDCMVGSLLPTCHFSITDQSELILNNKLIQDGTTVSFVIKALGTPHSRTYNFRVFKFRQEKSTMGTKWEADGYWDAPLYWLGTSSEGVRGTSSFVLSDLAARCGLKFEGDVSADPQLWMPQNRTYGEWVREIVKRGYLNDQSLMISGVDLTGTLRYLDFNKDSTSVLKMVYGMYKSEETPVQDFGPSSNSGFNNKLTGYSNNRRAQSVLGTADQIAHNTVEFKPDSREPLFNMNLKEKQQRGYQQFSPIDFGNVHESYERARYQNMRYANLYSLVVDFMTSSFTGLNLFDTFTFATRQEGGKVDNQYSGKYKVTAVNITIQGANYAEYIEGTRHGTNLVE
ncbi:hypothetical protein D3C87_1183380 [compost metagenome]